MRLSEKLAFCSGTKDSLVPNSPVFTETHSGSPVRLSRYTWPAEPILSPSCSYTSAPERLRMSFCVIAHGGGDGGKIRGGARRGGPGGATACRRRRRTAPRPDKRHRGRRR